MRDSTLDSCATDVTSSVAWTVARWSGLTFTLAATRDVDLVLGDHVGDVGEQARPVVGLDPDRDRVGLLDRASHSTSISRLTSLSLTTVGHVGGGP